MPKTNYSFEKRQRELASKRKKDEKAERKSRPSPHPVTTSSDTPESADRQGAAGDATGESK